MPIQDANEEEKKDPLQSSTLPSIGMNDPMMKRLSSALAASNAEIAEMKEKVRKLESLKTINTLELGSIGEQEEAKDSSRDVSKRAKPSSPEQLDFKRKKVSPEILVEEAKEIETESCFGSQAANTQLVTIEPAIEANINDLNRRSSESQVNASNKPKQNQEAPEFK